MTTKTHFSGIEGYRDYGISLPSNPSTGEEFIDSENNMHYIWDGSLWWASAMTTSTSSSSSSTSSSTTSTSTSSTSTSTSTTSTSTSTTTTI